MSKRDYKLQSFHIAERLRLREIRDRLSLPPLEFSNYELVLKYADDSYCFAYNHGAIVFFNVPDDVLARELQRFQELAQPAPDQSRASDIFTVSTSEIVAGEAPPSNRVYFDRVVVAQLSFQVVKLVSMLLAESTALEYYEQLVEKLLEQANVYSKSLRREGKLIRNQADLLKFIGLCLDTKQEIIANLYIVDSPDETWESVELDKLHQELKAMLEVDPRFRALDYKIRIIEETLQTLVDVSKSKRETFLEVTIIGLIAVEIALSLFKH